MIGPRLGGARCVCVFEKTVPVVIDLPAVSDGSSLLFELIAVPPITSYFLLYKIALL